VVKPAPTPAECRAQWRIASEICSELLADPDSRGVTGNYPDMYNCMRGLVSEACGGNRIEY